MKKQFATFVVAATASFAAIVFADGIIIPPRGVDISVKYHHVTVDIDGQVAETAIDQVFLNDSPIDSVEGTYVFPLPKDAAFSDFSMFVNDEELSAEIFAADEARAIYESIVRRNLDPALLEYLGRGLFRASVYPILKEEGTRVKISYSELLNFDSDVYRYIYPLSTEKFSARPLEDVSITITLKSNNPIKTIYSPSHNITVNKIDDFSATVTYSEQDVKPDRDFVLYYSASSDDIGMHLLTYNSTDEDGFYLFMASPKYDIEDSDIVAKRLVFVLDRSGSMTGEKIQQAKEALRFNVSNLNEIDSFNIIDFSSSSTSFRQAPVAATAPNIQDALSYIDGLSANGGTNINEALLLALGELTDTELANIVVFLTDGQPTVGVTSNEDIERNVSNANTQDARLFVFGVGFNVNTHLLDGLSGANHGVSTYVRPDENIEVAVSSFLSKIKNPVLSNLSLSYGTVSVYDFFPKELPDLFQGSQIIELGRYNTGGSTTIKLTGDVNGQVKEFQHQVEFPAENTEHDFMPRLWATRKIGYLLDEVRHNGESQELIDEIVLLGKRYGIITPYTSFLILEDVPTGDTFSDLSEQTGEYAVRAASDIGSYRNANTSSGVMSAELRYVGNKTFFMRDDFWVDTEYAGDEVEVRVEFAGDVYFGLLKNNEKLGQYFAIGKNLVVSTDGKVYIVSEKDIEFGGLPEQFFLLPNYPNPFNPGTTIRFLLARTAEVRLSVYDILGRKVRVLFEGNKPAGEHAIIWDGNKADGTEAASGVYFYRLSTNRSAKVGKMVKLK